MSRLVHSDTRSYLRYMQASRHQLFAFVEGPKDRFFYGAICSAAVSGAGISYEIATAAELPGQTGGKPALLGFYRELKVRRKLLHDFKGKSIGTVFFLDKDIDDLLGKQLRSRYLVYTECFDFEGHAFKHGSLKGSAAPAAFVEPELLDPLLADDMAWLSSAAQRWKDWVQLCLFCTMRNIRCVCTFGNASRINQPPSSPTDAGRLKAHLAIVKRGSGLSSADFKRAFGGIRQLVDGLYAKSKHHRIFKGKWFPVILEADLREHARVTNRAMMLNNFGDRMLSTLLQSLNFSDSWAQHFIRPVRKILQRLKPTLAGA